MACHEIAALRLGTMNILGIDDEAERAHELAELGELANTPGPLASLAKARDLDTLVKLYATSLVDLNDKVARASSNDPKLPYWRSLLVLTKKVELDLRAHVDGLTRMNRELEEMHDLVHELFPVDLVMASNPKVLRVVDARAAGPDTRVLQVECIEGGAFSAIGGKYVIVHTGLHIGEKAVKRAYSLAPVAGEPTRAELTIKRLADGPGSNALHAADVGAELSFSGPWGKLVPEGGLAARTLLVGTDTGITSALGVVLQAHATGVDATLNVLWLTSAEETFLPTEGVRARVEAAGARFEHASIPSIDCPERAEAAWAHIDRCIEQMRAELVIAAGDGAIVFPLRERYGATTSVRDVRIECFFRNPEKKSV